MNFGIQAIIPLVKSATRIGMLSAFFLAPSAFAETVDMVMTGTVNTQVLGGYYVNPYTATVNGAVTTVICDDFSAETYIGQAWQATVTTFDKLADNLSIVRWGSAGTATQVLDLYNQAAWLSLKLLDNVGTAAQGRISYAIWALFRPDALDGLNSSDAAGANNWITQSATARANGFTAGANFSIYTPVVGTNPFPQEFISVQTPESSTIPMLAFNFTAVLAVAYLLRRRLIHSAN